MKIQLVHPQGGSKLSSSGILPPLGIISLATYLKYINPDIEIQLFDGEVTDQQDIINNLNGDVLGISTTGANYHNALEIARKAKEKGANVILGGPHATIKYKQILKNQDCIDAVVRGDGEPAFYDYIKSIGLEKLDGLKNIRNLAYKLEDKIFVNPMLSKEEQIDLNNLSSPDYNFLLDLRYKYEKNFQKHSYKKKGFTSFKGMESQKGCPKSEKQKRCTFCARIDKGMRRLNPENFWKRVTDLYGYNGKIIIWDFSDSFTGKISKDDKWLEEIAENKPKYLDDKVYFKIFARSDELDEKTVSYLNKIGVKEVFIGAESGDQEKLNSSNKGLRLEDNITAVENLKKKGIETYVSFIYGLPGESFESLDKTLYHMEEIIQKGSIEGIGVRCLFPFAGMRVHNDLIRKLKEAGKIKLAQEIRDSDGYDAVELQRLWIDHMTYLSFEDIIEHHEKMMMVAKKYNVRINNKERLLLI